MQFTIAIDAVLTSSGRWHRRIVIDGEPYTPERCNLDDAEIVTFADSVPSDATLCQRCGDIKPLGQ